MKTKGQEMMELVDRYVSIMSAINNVELSPPSTETIKEGRAKLQAIADSLDWISVKDRLPEDYVEVLVVDKKKIIWTGNCWIDGIDKSAYWTDSESVPIDDVTHWKPLPEPPTEK